MGFSLWELLHSYLCSFVQQILMDAWQVPNTILDLQDTVMKKTNKVTALKELESSWKASLLYVVMCILGFPGGASGKRLACHCRRHKRHGFTSWVGKIPWRRKWQLTSVVLPGESHGQRSLVAIVPRVAKSQTQQTHSVYMSKLISQFIALSPSPSMSTSLFPTFVRIF